MNDATDRALRETILSSERVFEGKLVRVDRLSVALPDGRPASREAVRHVGAAAVVAVDERCHVALVRQYRAPLDRVLMELPAGKLDGPGEDRLVAARRELAEETGFTADHWEHLTDLITTPGFCDEVIGLYLATGLHKGASRPDEDEFLNVIMVPFDDAVNMTLTGEIADAKTVSGLMLASAKLRG